MNMLYANNSICNDVLYVNNCIYIDRNDDIQSKMDYYMKYNILHDMKNKVNADFTGNTKDDDDMLNDSNVNLKDIMENDTKGSMHDDNKDIFKDDMLDYNMIYEIKNGIQDNNKDFMKNYSANKNKDETLVNIIYGKKYNIEDDMKYDMKDIMKDDIKVDMEYENKYDIKIKPKTHMINDMKYDKKDYVDNDIGDKREYDDKVWLKDDRIVYNYRDINKNISHKNDKNHFENYDDNHCKKINFMYCYNNDEDVQCYDNETVNDCSIEKPLNSSKNVHNPSSDIIHDIFNMYNNDITLYKDTCLKNVYMFNDVIKNYNYTGFGNNVSYVDIPEESVESVSYPFMNNSYVNTVVKDVNIKIYDCSIKRSLNGASYMHSLSGTNVNYIYIIIL